jgi:general secretion pathway protein F
MPVFAYKALASNGSVTTGELDAADRPEALRKLDRKGLQPVNLKETASATPAARKPAGKGRAKAEEAPRPASKTADKQDDEIPEGPVKLKRAEVVLFTEELSDMLGAGLQLEPALKSMENRQELGNLKAVSYKVRQIVRDGVNFSVALKKVSPSFGPLYCSLAAAGEASGALDTILKRQAHYLKTLAELQSRLILAMIYPAFLVLAGIGVSVVFVTTLIPQLTQLIESTPGGKIPHGGRDPDRDFGFPQQVVDRHHSRNHRRRDLLQGMEGQRGEQADVGPHEAQAAAHGSGHHQPLLRPVPRNHGQPRRQRPAPAPRPRAFPRRHPEPLAARRAQPGHRSGRRRPLVFQGPHPQWLVSALLIDMISVGEQTGKIDQSLRRAAERYDKELDKDLQRIMALIMPTVLIIMAGLIGTMAYLMITAIFQTGIVGSLGLNWRLGSKSLRHRVMSPRQNRGIVPSSELRSCLARLVRESLSPPAPMSIQPHARLLHSRRSRMTGAVVSADPRDPLASLVLPTARPLLGSKFPA